MENKDLRSLYKNISPLDHRYYLANRELFEKLSLYLSEEATVKYLLQVEEALVLTHLSIKGLLTPELEKTVKEATKKVDPSDVYLEEEKTQHNIRALVNVYMRYLPEDIRPYVHLGATSVDIMDTAAALRYRDVTREVLLPLLIEVEERLIEIAEKEAETAQVGRTHGQHAVPITFGFAIAEYVSRLGKSIKKISELVSDLRGKFAGAVGAYNATSVLVKDPIELEKKIMDRLALLPSDHSTQLVEPEHLLRLLLEYNIAFGIIANLADDLRHLQRTEIGEVREYFSSTQVGSSTMPHKRNPWNSEHVKSLWKAFAPRVMTFFTDQISEHQRDLSNSASGRFITDYLAGFAAACARMNKILKGLSVERDRMQANLTMGGDFVLAEAAYILLARSGIWEGHEIIRKLTLESEKTGKRLVELLKEDKELWSKLARALAETTGDNPELFFSEPWRYRGKATDKAISLANLYKKEMQNIKESL
ncbi:lyase family protein [Spirochaetia bacterium 38H-sp]|uniref:Lyase family protein n=1 Tax=Rarispira pelagica TaxID=3141764 RepID=A0ABU9UDV7_9SPIR